MNAIDCHGRGRCPESTVGRRRDAGTCAERVRDDSPATTPLADGDGYDHHRYDDECRHGFDGARSHLTTLLLLPPPPAILSITLRRRLSSTKTSDGVFVFL
jgi:hypothetical protein